MKIEYISGSTVWILYCWLLLCGQVEDYQNILKLLCERLAQIKPFFFFKKKKRRLELISLHHFLHDFLRKMFLKSYSSNWPNFVVWLSLRFEILGNTYTASICFVVYEVINFEVNLIFLIKPFFCTTKKVRKSVWIP